MLKFQIIAAIGAVMGAAVLTILENIYRRRAQRRKAARQ
jgi:hypothetical protein